MVAVELFCARGAARELEGVGSAPPLRFTSGTVCECSSAARDVTESALAAGPSFQVTEGLTGAFPLSSKSCTATFTPKVVFDANECLKGVDCELAAGGDSTSVLIVYDYQ